MAKIRVQSLSKTYSGGQVLALDNVNLDVEDNESLCILGPSGCGKTTLLRIIDGLIACDGGEVVIDSTPVTCPRPDVAMVFQHFGLFPWKRLHENIAFGLALRSSGADRKGVINRYVELMGLKGFENSYPHQLSGGMAQRAALARALALDPTLLFLDEPTAGLDPISAAAFDELVSYLHRGLSLTIVMITHDLDTLLATCNRVAVLIDRKIVVDTLDGIMKNPHPWIQEYFHGPRARAAQLSADKLSAGQGREGR
jgi:phospholipid/cholesterol/gamma-HCH transport system ATP-binding protein